MAAYLKTFAVASMILAGSLTAFTQTDGSTITVAGKKYVLVSERMFGQIEKLVAEVPALRDENAALKAEKANADKLIALDAEKDALQAKLLIATENALQAAENAQESQSKRADSEASARVATEKALAISEADRERLKKKASRYRLIAIGAVTISVVARVLGL